MTDRDLKFTDLDYATASHHLQMLKAAVPYMEIPQQKFLAFFIKWSELKRTMSFFEENSDGMMSVCSLEQEHASPTDMLTAMKPHANSKEQELIELLAGVLARKKTSPNEKTAITPEQLLSFLPPEQQARMETMQLIMQTIGQL